jgi:hypothetical protein
VGNEGDEDSGGIDWALPPPRRNISCREVMMVMMMVMVMMVVVDTYTIL